MLQRALSLARYLRQQGLPRTLAALGCWVVRQRIPLMSSVVWKVAFRWNPWVSTAAPLYAQPGLPSTAYDCLLGELADLGLNPERIRLDPQRFWSYYESASYPTSYYADYRLHPYRVEKILEHWLSACLLDLRAEDTLIDIASADSPFSVVARRLYGCRTFAQDMAFPPGVQGDRIGGNAANMPLPDNFATAMTLHCSFEHFENDSDRRFLEEARRVLCPGGRLCILPLYLSDEYCIVTDPYACYGADRWDREARRCYVPGWIGGRHTRYYSPARFKEIVDKRATGFHLRLLFVENPQDIDPLCYVRFIALFEKR